MNRKLVTILGILGLELTGIAITASCYVRALRGSESKSKKEKFDPVKEAINIMNRCNGTKEEA